MADITIIILQISSPFILLGLLLTWIYRLHKNVALLTRRWESSLSESESIWRSMREREADIYLKIETVEGHVEDIEDHLVLHDAEEMLRGNKTKPKTK